MIVKRLCEFFWNVESKHGLYDREFAGIKIWQAYRMYFYYEIAEKAGILDTAHSEKKSFTDRAKNIGAFLRSCILGNPFFSFGQRDAIIFDHKRKVKADTAYIDIYTEPLIKELKERGENIEVWEQPYNSRHYSAEEPFRFHLDFPLFLSKMLSFFMFSSLSKEDLQIIDDLEDQLNNRFGLDISLAERFRTYIKVSKAKKIIFGLLLKLKRPPKLYIVVAYGQPIVISVAKELGIEVIELQHGIISKYHLGYSYPYLKSKNSLTHFPDQIWVWDDFWKEMAPFPINQSKLSVYPFRHIQNMKEQYGKAEKKEDQILVISQGIIGDKIAGELLRDIENLRDYNILFKLHPGEVNHWHTYQNLTKLSQYPNVKVKDGSKHTIYELMAESKIVVGVFSTAIFEAVAFECIIFLLELPGIENMDDFVNTGNAVLVKKDNHLSACLAKY